jgi:hypothetical protein
MSAAIRARLGDTNGAEKDRRKAFDLDNQREGAPHVDLPPPLPPVKKDPEPGLVVPETANSAGFDSR